MVNLTRIYTRTGDDGMTHLGDMSRTSKTDVRLTAYADANEANAAIGVALAAATPRGRPGHPHPDPERPLRRGRRPVHPLQATYEYPPLRVQQVWIDELEADCDRYLASWRSPLLHPPRRDGSAYLHVATTVARRAERQAWAAIAAYGDQPGTTRGEGGINVLTAKYLNRLSGPALRARTSGQPAHRGRRAVAAGRRARAGTGHEKGRRVGCGAWVCRGLRAGTARRGFEAAGLGDVDVEPGGALSSHDRMAVYAAGEARAGRCPRRSGRSPRRPRGAPRSPVRRGLGLGARARSCRRASRARSG